MRDTVTKKPLQFTGTSISGESAERIGWIRCELLRLVEAAPSWHPDRRATVIAALTEVIQALDVCKGALCGLECEGFDLRNLLLAGELSTLLVGARDALSKMRGTSGEEDAEIFMAINSFWGFWGVFSVLVSRDLTPDWDAHKTHDAVIQLRIVLKQIGKAETALRALLERASVDISPFLPSDIELVPLKHLVA